MQVTMSYPMQHRAIARKPLLATHANGVTKFGSLITSPYTVYDFEQTCKGTFSAEHRKIYEPVDTWIKTVLPQTRCVFPKLGGNIAFAVYDTLNKAELDFPSIVSCVDQTIREKFPVLTQDNAAKVNQQCLIIALPNITNEAYSKLLLERFRKLNTSTISHGVVSAMLWRFPGKPDFDLPFPIMLIRYMRPEDWKVLPSMTSIETALLRYLEVYDPPEK